MTNTLSRVLLLLFASAALLFAGDPVVQADDDEETNAVEVGNMTLKIPKSWKQEKPKSSFRLAQFRVPAAKDDKTGAELVVFHFKGGGGGVDANIKRWASQFDAPGRVVKVTSGKSDQGDYVFVEISGTTSGKANYHHMNGVILTSGDQVYYLKMVGPTATIIAAGKQLRTAIGADADKEKEYKPGK